MSQRSLIRVAASATTADFAGDAAGVAFLSGRRDVDPRQRALRCNC